MRFLEYIASLAGPRNGQGVQRTGRWLAGAVGVLVAGLVLGLHLLLTVIRHEALHIVGGLFTGGLVTRVQWLPRPWTLGLVEVTPPLGATPAAYYVPLLLPYLADLILIVSGLWVCRRFRLLPTAKRLIVQHAVYFAALDILVNCAAAVTWFNDWTMILEGWGAWRYAVLCSIIAACLATLVVGRRISSHDGLPDQQVWWVPVQTGGRS